MSEENGCCANINNGSFKKDDCYNHTQLLIKKLKFSTKICSTIMCCMCLCCRFLSMRQNVKKKRFLFWNFPWNDFEGFTWSENDMLERDRSQLLVLVWMLSGLRRYDLPCQTPSAGRHITGMRAPSPSTNPMIPIHQATFLYEQCHLNDTAERRLTSSTN